jgi:LmbE family N-acetylglucosaminyl deacetylase
MKILVVAAHPDDEVLGCGGTMARLAQAGHQLAVAILGEGVMSRHPQGGQAAEKELAAVKASAHQAAAHLGVEHLWLYDLPDNRFDTVALLDIVKRIEEILDRFAPETIYTHHGGDLNVDHRVVHQAVLTAARPLPGQQVREILAFEVPSSTEWSFQGLAPAFRPNVFVDISRTLELKLQGMALYQSEVRAFPHPRSPESITALARRWGSVVGCAAAEAFELMRAIR